MVKECQSYREPNGGPADEAAMCNMLKGATIDIYDWTVGEVVLNVYVNECSGQICTYSMSQKKSGLFLADASHFVSSHDTCRYPDVKAREAAMKLLSMASGPVEEREFYGRDSLHLAATVFQRCRWLHRVILNSG